MKTLFLIENVRTERLWHNREQLLFVVPLHAIFSLVSKFFFERLRCIVLILSFLLLVFLLPSLLPSLLPVLLLPAQLLLLLLFFLRY